MLITPADGWARRGKLIGLLLWPGALFYALYNYLVYALAMPFGLTYVLYLLMITIGGCLLVDLVASIDQAAVQQRLSGAVPEQLAGGILIGIGVLIFLRTIVMMVSALLSGVHPSRLDVALLTTDLVTSPIWVIGGLALWRRRPFGYGVGAGLLFQGSMLFVGLIVVLLMQPIVGGGPLAVVDILIVFVMGFICFIPFVLFVWGIIRASA